jgi:hypothetical protein
MQERSVEREGKDAGSRPGLAQKNVFVIGLDELHRDLFEALPAAAECSFHPLLGGEPPNPLHIPPRVLLERARAELDAFPGSVDGIAGYWDFPTSCIVPILCAERGLPSAPLEAVLRCEHKYWSRVLQREVIPQHVPGFCVVDPFDSRAAESIELDFPFWIKPVKSFNSYLGFYVGGPGDLEHALASIRTGIGSLAEPFDYVLSMIELPPKIKPVTGAHCIAEQIISAGRQCTVEGWGFRGEYQVYGVIDSIRHPGRSTFARYQYPSSLPAEVQQQMAEISCRVMRHLGYDGSHFNIEYFWDPDTGRIWLLEINSRISQSHSELFAKVDGAANHAVLVDLALGRRPDLPYREGPFRCAAKFYERAFQDGVVRSVPSRERIKEIEGRFPGAAVHVRVRPGTRLSDLGRQESYSYELAWIYMGAADEENLLADHDELVEMLDIELEPVAGQEPGTAQR